MEQVGRSLRSSGKLSKEEHDLFDDLLAHAVSTPWWRQFIRQIEVRLDSYISKLIAGGLDVRAEDTLRGQINELKFIILVDERGKSLTNGKVSDGGS